jgi:hypothetical protein
MNLKSIRKIIYGITASLTCVIIILNLMVYQLKDDFSLGKDNVPKIWKQSEYPIEAVNSPDLKINWIECKSITEKAYGRIEEVEDNLFFIAVKQSAVHIDIIQSITFQKFISAHFATST